MAARIISIINHKGGTGKTTSSLEIAAALSRKKKKVLLVDLDTQMNLTHWLLGDIPEDCPQISDCMTSSSIPLSSVIQATSIPRLFIAPAGESMVDLELKLYTAFNRESILKKLLETLSADYDYILIDNPPSINLTAINSLVAAHYWLTPVSCEYLPLVGIRHLLKTIDTVKNLNPQIQHLGFLLTMVDRRESITSDIEAVLRESFPQEVLKQVIRINTKFKACPQKKQSIFSVEGKAGKGSIDYQKATEEIVKKLEKHER